MNILISVNFSHPEFKKDFDLSNALLLEHTVLLVTNDIQLNNASNHYDLLILGKSTWDKPNFNGKTMDYRVMTKESILDAIQSLWGNIIS